MIYALIGCLIIIIGFLGFKLYQKQSINKQELEEYNFQLQDLQRKVKDQWTSFQLASDNLETVQRTLIRAKQDTVSEKLKLDECRKDLESAMNTYQNIVDKNMKDIEDSMEEQRQKRKADLDQSLNETKEKYEFMKEKAIKECMDEVDSYWRERDQQKILADNEITQYKIAVEELKIQYESLLEPIKQYEKEKQEKLFYTIQLPEEYQEDIEFLLVTVAAKVQHPDIISKLVWAEYVKPNLDNTFKRIEIKDEPGIYKLTSLIDNKSYIGKSTDVKKRIADHFKSSIGIRSIADQAVHHAILKEGFWNWQIEVITYCDKERLNELEKYYIDFFKTQEYGYNKTAGG